jgi:hypothetical protein
MTYGALPAESAAANGSKRSPSLRRNAGWFIVAALGACALAGLLVNFAGRDASVLMTSIAPGTQLELQTSQGPMTLTVNSPMNAAGYVHAFGTQASSAHHLFPDQGAHAMIIITIAHINRTISRRSYCELVHTHSRLFHTHNNKDAN